MRLTLLLIIAGLFISSCTDSAVSTLNELNVNDSTLANETKKDSTTSEVLKDSLENVNQSSIDSLKAIADSIADSIANSTVIDTIIETTPEDSASDVVKDEPKNETSTTSVQGTWRLVKQEKFFNGESCEKVEAVESSEEQSYFIVSNDSITIVAQFEDSLLSSTKQTMLLIASTQFYTIDNENITIEEDNGTLSTGGYELSGDTLLLTDDTSDTTEIVTLVKNMEDINTSELMGFEAYMTQVFMILFSSNN